MSLRTSTFQQIQGEARAELPIGITDSLALKQVWVNSGLEKDCHSYY